MVGSIGSSSNLYTMISVAYQQGGGGFQGGIAPEAPGGKGQDKLGMFDAADIDGNGGISLEEYAVLTTGITEVTGSEFSGEFSDYDQDEDGILNGTELKSVLDDAGFTPPPPPPRQVSEAYAAQGGTWGSGSEDQDLLAQLLEYLETRSYDDDLDIIA